jgi:glyoxylase-like metal-dependent hydrolase (beta-lactamase superfamily II)
VVRRIGIRQSEFVELAPGIRRTGTESMINAYLVEEAGQVTVVDAGVAGLYRDLPDELAAMGRTLADVRALILTHGHSDHVGFAERLRTEHPVPVMVHEADAALARGEVPNPSKGFGSTKIGPLLGFLWFSAAHGDSGRVTSARSRPSATARRWMCPEALA